MTQTAEAVTHIDDPRFRVTEWRFAPGAETGWHVHGHDYVIVPLTDGRLKLDHPDGTTSHADLQHGVPYSRRCGVEHNVTNAAPAPLSFLEVEVVDDARDRARLAVMDRFARAWNTGDLAALMDCMAADCAFHTSAGPDAQGAVHRGRAAVEAAYAEMLGRWEHCVWDNAQHSISGDVGLSRWRFRGRLKGGGAVEVDGCDILHFDGEKIAVKDSYRKARG